MAELISLIVFLLSLSVTLVIVFRKLPALSQLPESVPSQPRERPFFDLRKIREITLPQNLSTNIILQKILSRIRVLTLKTDHKTSSWLQKLRECSQKKKFGEDDNYWQEIRKSTRK